MDLPNKSNYSTKRSTHIRTIVLILMMMMITRMRKILLCKSLDRTRLLGWQAIVEEFVQGYKLWASDHLTLLWPKDPVNFEVNTNYGIKWISWYLIMIMTTRMMIILILVNQAPVDVNEIRTPVILNLSMTNWQNTQYYPLLIWTWQIAQRMKYKKIEV